MRKNTYALRVFLPVVPFFCRSIIGYNYLLMLPNLDKPEPKVDTDKKEHRTKSEISVSSYLCLQKFLPAVQENNSLGTIFCVVRHPVAPDLTALRQKAKTP